MTGAGNSDRPDSPHVLAPPPLIFLGALAVGLVLESVWPLGLLADGVATRVVGGILMVGGVVLSGAVVLHFSRARTPITPWRESRALVTTGPYRFSRNPDYIGQALITAGAGIALAAAWVLVALVPALVLVRYGVVAREERYLERRFGEEYRRYCAKVRRWL